MLKRLKRKEVTTIEDIPRVVLAVGEVGDPALENLAAQASALLGYNLLAQAIYPGRLREALAELEIEVLDEKAVREYQKTLGNISNLTEGEPDEVEEDDDEDEAPRVKSQMVWVSTPLHHFQGQVPEFVLRKAVQIKTKVPRAKFHVEHLTKVEIEPDPFLVVSLEEESFIVEVWAEPGFEFLTKKAVKKSSR